jgi:hypothetical protein
VREDHDIGRRTGGDLAGLRAGACERQGHFGGEALCDLCHRVTQAGGGENGHGLRHLFCLRARGQSKGEGEENERKNTAHVQTIRQLVRACKRRWGCLVSCEIKL